MSQWPQIAGSNIELGVDVTLPWGYIGAARKAKQLEKVIGKYIVPGANVDKKVSDLLTDKGMGRRDFMKMAGTLGVIGALKALGLEWRASNDDDKLVNIEYERGIPNVYQDAYELKNAIFTARL